MTTAWRSLLSKMKRPDPAKVLVPAPLVGDRTYAVGDPSGPRQDQTRPRKASSRGENFSAKHGCAVCLRLHWVGFCHKGPQGLGKNAGSAVSRGFARAYTNSPKVPRARQLSAKIPSGRSRRKRERRAAASLRLRRRRHRAVLVGWFETPAASEGKPPRQNEARKPPAGQAPAGQNAAGHTPPARASRASVKPDEDPVAAPARHRRPITLPRSRRSLGRSRTSLGPSRRTLPRTRGVSAEPAASRRCLHPSEPDRRALSAVVSRRRPLRHPRRRCAGSGTAPPPPPAPRTTTSSTERTAVRPWPVPRRRLVAPGLVSPAPGSKNFSAGPHRLGFVGLLATLAADRHVLARAQPSASSALRATLTVTVTSTSGCRCTGLGYRSSDRHV